MHPNQTLRAIQKEYAELLEDHFRELWKDYEISGDTPISFLARTDHFRSSIILGWGPHQTTSMCQHANELLDAVASFWRTNKPRLHAALADCRQLMTQVGDLNGVCSYYRTTAKKLALYFDSICLIDALAIRASRRDSGKVRALRSNDDPNLITLLVDFLEMRGLTKLLRSETDTPIAMFVPPAGVAWDEPAHDQLCESSKNLALSLFAEVLDQPLPSLEAAFDAVSKTSGGVFSKRVMGHETLAKMFAACGADSIPKYTQLMAVEAEYEFQRRLQSCPKQVRDFGILFGMIQGTFLALEGASASASNMRIDVAIPYEQWAINEYRLKQFEIGLKAVGVRMETPVQAAILSGDMDWLEAATLGDLVGMREEGLMEEIRSLFHIESALLQKASPTDFEAAVRAVVNNVSEAINAGIEQVEKERHEAHKFLKKSGRNLMIGSALGIAGALAPQEWSPLLTMAGFVIAGDTPFEYLASLKQRNEVLENPQRRPITHMVSIWAKPR
ncbi:MAG: hypothetical protein ACOYOF_17430 [Verrucomicrobiaceae bacterium]